MSAVAMSHARLAAAVALASLLLGCATHNPRDPLEPLNRKVYAFNEALDAAVLEPVATTYQDVVPSPVRTGVGNFFANIGDAWSAVNGFLQFKLETGLKNTMRFGLNTLFGLGGVLDIATEAGIEAEDEDLGQTLGRWGVGPGPYLVLPLLGPSTLRDAPVLPLEAKADSWPFRHSATASYSALALRVIDARADLLGATGMLEDAALDPYLFVRDAYLQRRQSLVYDGDPPATQEPPEEDVGPTPADAAPAAAEAPASAASQ